MLAEQDLDVILMVNSPEKGVDPYLFHSEGYARQYMTLMEGAKLSFIEFQQLCKGGRLVLDAKSLAPSRKTARNLRRQETRKKLLDAISRSSNSPTLLLNSLIVEMLKKLPIELRCRLSSSFLENQGCCWSYLLQEASPLNFRTPHLPRWSPPMPGPRICTRWWGYCNPPEIAM